MKRELYREFASTVDAYHRCVATGNTEWRDKHEERLTTLAKDHLPSGSGFDCGTTIDIDKSTGERLVFHTSFHHMDEAGGYDGWTEHTVTVRASLIHGFTLTISGRNRNDIKDYIGEVFQNGLSGDVELG
jgi:hypothetical protein